jgi:hypothetical protein
VLGAKPAHRIPKGQHGPHRGKGFVGVALDVFPEAALIPVVYLTVYPVIILWIIPCVSCMV